MVFVLSNLNAQHVNGMTLIELSGKLVKLHVRLFDNLKCTYAIDKVKLVLKKLRRKLLVNSTLPLSSRWV